MVRFLIAGLIAASTLLTLKTQHAEACSPPLPEWEVRIEPGRLGNMPLDGAITAFLQGEGGELVVSVTTEGGDEVVGSARRVRLSPVREASWLSQPEYVFVWTPDALWEPETTYDVVIEEEDSHSGELQVRAEATFTTGTEVMASEDSFVFENAGIRLTELPTRQECCVVEGCMLGGGECGPSPCEECWDVAFKTYPVLGASLKVAATNAEASQYFMRFKDDFGEVRTEYWMPVLGVASTSIVYGHDAATTYCIHVEVEKLATGEVFTVVPRCAQVPSGISDAEVERDERPEWLVCEGEEPEVETPPEARGGCSAIDRGPGGGGMALGVVAMLFAMRVRRRGER